MRLGLLLSLFLIGCANSTNKCGDKFVLLWPDASGSYSFQEVSLSTLPSPYELKGSAAEIYFQPGLTKSGFEGEVVRPRLTNSDGVCVPTDVGSSISITAYAVMENLLKFENALGVAGQVSWPRKVGVELLLRGDEVDIQNNAHYFGEQDVIGVVPYTRDRLPISLNHGILAHEHFHAHFQSQVIAKINTSLPEISSMETLFSPGSFAFKPTNIDLDDDFRSPHGLNNYILRSWNEGLADFYAAIFTGRADFFVDSLPVARRLDLPLAALATAGDFQMIANNTFPEPGRPAGSLVGFSYAQGSMIARLFYSLAHSQALPPKEFLAEVMKRLQRLPALVVPEYSTTVLEPDSMVPVLLSGLELSSEACDSLRVTVGKNAMMKGLPQCSGL